MARNFAQLVFLAYALCIFLYTRRHVATFLVRRIGRKNLERRTRSKANRYLFLSLKKALPPILFWPNFILYTALMVLTVFHLLLGWFSFASLALCILDAIFLILAGLFTFFLASLGNLLEYKKMLVLYEPDNNPETNRAFSSSLMDAIWFLAIPLAMAIGGFYL